MNGLRKIIQLINIKNFKKYSIEYFLFLGRVILSFIFIYAGADKISDPAGFSQAIQNYKLFPSVIINFLAITVPWLELVCGLLLLVGINTRENSLIISSMLFLFTLAIGISMVRGLNFDCGCFGRPSPIGWQRLLENFSLLIIGIVLILYDSKFLTIIDQNNSK